MANSAYDKLVFEELTGKKRRVVLQGTEAPKGHVRGSPAFDLGGEVRRIRKENPGSDEPTIHVMGNKQRDLVVQCHFRDSMTGKKGNAENRVNLIESIRSGGNPLRVVWGTFTRFCILRETKFPVEGEGEFQAELTFEPIGTGVPKRRSPHRPLSLPTSLDGLQIDLGVAAGALKLPGLHLDFSGIVDGLFSLVTGPLTALLGFADDLLGSVEELGTDADSVRRRLFQIANHAKQLQKRAADVLSFVGSAEEPIEDAIDGALWRRAQSDATEALRNVLITCQDLGEAAESRAAGASSGRIYTTRDGDTVESIASKSGTTVAAILNLNPDLPVGGVLTAGLKVKLP